MSGSVGRSGVILGVAAIVTGSVLMSAVVAGLPSAERRAALFRSEGCDDRVFPYVQQSCPASRPVIMAEPARSPETVVIAAVTVPPIDPPAITPAPVGPVAEEPAPVEAAKPAAIVERVRPVRPARTYEPIRTVRPVEPKVVADAPVAERRDGPARQVRVIPIDRPDASGPRAAVAAGPTPTILPPPEPVIDLAAQVPVPPAEAPATAPAPVAQPGPVAAVVTGPAREVVLAVGVTPAATPTPVVVPGPDAPVAAPPETNPVSAARPAVIAREVDDRPVARGRRSRQLAAREEIMDERPYRYRRYNRYSRYASRWYRRRRFGDWVHPEAPTRTYREGRRWVASEDPPPPNRYYYRRPAERSGGVLGFLGVN